MTVYAEPRYRGHEERSGPAPCVNQSLSEFFRGHHTTWNADRVCDRCRSAATGPPGSSREPGKGHSPALPAPSLASAAATAARDALQSATGEGPASLSGTPPTAH